MRKELMGDKNVYIAYIWNSPFERDLRFTI